MAAWRELIVSRALSRPAASPMAASAPRSSAETPDKASNMGDAEERFNRIELGIS